MLFGSQALLPARFGRWLWYHTRAVLQRALDVSRALALLVLATLLRWLSYPDRRLFRRLCGDQSLELSLPAAAGDGVDRFIPKGPAWDGPALERFARSSTARWILWQEDGAGADGDGMRHLFEDERTFAVSRQDHFRSWKPMLVALAPFRTLQPDGASQVLAPLSPTMLVDRRKLLALGVPRSRLAATAWMLLFWKAAAAGWRSYSVGQRKIRGEQPDLPVHERAFILRVLFTPALRRLGPREPDLARGNIAFAPALQRSALMQTDRLKVLVLSPFLPYPLAHGGAVRIYNLCRALGDRVDFLLVALHEAKEAVDYDKLHEVFRQVYVVDIDEHASLDTRLPRQVRISESSSLRALIGELARTWRPDLFQIEYTHMALYRDSAPQVPAILVEHDLTFSLYRQLAEHNPTREARDEYERWLAFERRWLREFDAVWTVSDDDRQSAIQEGARSPERTFAIPNGVDTRRFVPGEEPAATPEILFVGSFRHLPNVIGFEALRSEVMPRLWASFPTVRLRAVAGPQHESHWRAGPLDRRIELHGFVEDLRPLYTRAAVVVIPLAVSAGTNIKVLEAMACGKALVTTPAGCAGLGIEDGHDALIRAEWAEFARAVSELLSDPGLRSRLGAQGRRTAEQRFSWETIAARAFESYRALSHLRPSAFIRG